MQIKIENRIASKEIDSIPIPYGAILKLVFTAIPKVETKEVKDLFKGYSFSNCKLLEFAITQNALTEKSKYATLKSMSKDKIYNLNLSTGIGNIFIDKFLDQIEVKKPFYLEKIWSGNKYEPSLNVEISKN